MKTGEGFTYPLPTDVKSNTVQYWINKIVKEKNNAIVDVKLRESNGLVIATAVVKDEQKKEIAIKIRRDR